MAKASGRSHNAECVFPLHLQGATKRHLLLTYTNKQRTYEAVQVKDFKYLGVWFDERLMWAVHIKKIIDKCWKMLNVMRCLAGREWGPERSAPKSIYSISVRSVLDYGCVVFLICVRYKTKRKVDHIQYQALRLCSGAFRTTPTSA